MSWRWSLVNLGRLQAAMVLKGELLVLTQEGAQAEKSYVRIIYQSGRTKDLNENINSPAVCNTCRRGEREEEDGDDESGLVNGDYQCDFFLSLFVVGSFA